MIDNTFVETRLGYPLELKIELAKKRIIEFYEKNKGKVYIAFSGGKDSIVLLHLIRNIYPNIVAVFVDTGLEYPEIREFIKTIDNVVWLKPKQTFKQVIEKWGYPVISKQTAKKIHDLRSPNICEKYRNILLCGKGEKKFGKLSKKWLKLVDSPFKISNYCCDVLKKFPIKSFENKEELKGFIGNKIIDSRLRRISYVRNGGCNVFSKNKIISYPLSFFTDEDIWDYIKKYNLKYCDIYNMGVKRTGCVFCMFGVHLEKSPNRFELLYVTHHNLWKYCIYTLGIGKVLDYISVNYIPNETLVNYIEHEILNLSKSDT